MLSRLLIRNIVLIEKLEISFEQGLSIFTGETGAGKSILLDSLSLALGERGDGSLIKAGAESGEVTAIFEIEPNGKIYKFLQENNFDSEDIVILKRVQFKDGRSRAFVNDRPVTIGFLKDLGKLLVEMQGQHDNHN